MNTQLLSFGRKNAKLGTQVATFSIPAGHTCPNAQDCLSKADRITGKITDGPDTEYRCFSASGESLYPIVRDSRWHNFELLKKQKSLSALVCLIEKSLPKNKKEIRIHVSGDFYNKLYFNAWRMVAINNPDRLFYGYTKMPEFFLNEYIPQNFRFTFSFGGKKDYLIRQHNLKYALVVYSEEEAKRLGLAVDHDDSLAKHSPNSFALLIHGIQPKGTRASVALNILKRKGNYGYGEASKKRKLHAGTK